MLFVCGEAQTMEQSMLFLVLLFFAVVFYFLARQVMLKFKFYLIRQT